MQGTLFELMSFHEYINV